MTGLLNKEQIQNRKLLKIDRDKNYSPASYDLRIGRILNLESNEEVEEIEIPPQGMVLLFSQEEFNLPENVLGYTTVKNTQSIKGLLALNIGIVDPGYKGPISSILINFGKITIKLKKKERFLRMTFHEFEMSSSFTGGPKIQRYFETRKLEAMAYLGPKFLSLDKTKEEIRSYVTDFFLKWSILLASTLAFLTFSISIYINIQKSNKIEEFEEKLQTDVSSQIEKKFEEFKKNAERK